MPESIADDEIGPAALLEWGGSLGIAFYPDHASKSDLITRMRALAAPLAFREVRGGEAALALVAEEALIVVEPESEQATVQFFDQNRDQFTDARAKVLILLLKSGAGERALKDAPALASFAREASFDVPPRKTREASLAEFIDRHACTPEEWLTNWREGRLEDTLDNNYALSEALALTSAP